eukprot:gene527-1180_t
MPENHNNEGFLLKKNGTTDDAATVEVGLVKPKTKWTKLKILHLAVTLTLLVVCIVLIVIYVVKPDLGRKGERVFRSGNSNQVIDKTSKSGHNTNCTKADGKQAPVCLSPQCITLASQILNAKDNKADPCENFYQYACGGWQKKAFIPDSKGSWDTFWDLADANDKLLKKIFDKGKPNKNSFAEVELFKLFSSCNDVTAIESKGLKPFLDLIARLGSCKALNASWDESTWDLTEHLAKIHEVFPPIVYMQTDSPLFDLRVVVDIMQSSQHIIKISQPRNEMLMSNPDGTAGSDYAKAMVKTMTMLGSTNVSHYMTDVLELEKEIRKASLPIDVYRKISVSRQKTTIKGLQTEVKNNKLAWLRYLKLAARKTGFQVTEMTPIATQPLVYLKRLAKILDKTSKTTLANYFVWSLVKEFKEFLPRKIRDVFLKLLNAPDSKREVRWQKCLRQVESMMDMALGAMLVKETIDDSDKKEVSKMIDNIKDSFLDIVDKSEWMDAKTKVKATEKGKAIIGNIAYPSFIKNDTKLAAFYKGLALKDDAYFYNVLQLKEMKKRKSMMKLVSKVDREEWEFPPSMVNAFYDSGRNKMVFMAAILQSPFFSRYAPKPLNYGGIGMVMGHELSHAFDDQGRLFDEKGNLKPWWTENSTRAYRERVTCLKNQYSQYSIYNVSVNENRTISENIADNAGMKTSFNAYRKWVEKNGPPQRLPGIKMTNDQLFFLSSAQIWCSTETKAYTESSLRLGVHSPAVFRVKGSLSNMNEFSNAFNCPINSAMNPEKKCKFW